MSSHSSDVYVMEDTVGSWAPRSAHLQEGLVHSSSLTDSESLTEEGESQSPTPVQRIMCTVSTNTEEHVDGSVSALLHNGIMGLMQTIAGDGFANYALQKSNNDIRRCSAEIVTVARSTMQSLRLMAMKQTESMGVLRSSSEASPVNISSMPEWLEELQLSMTKTGNLLEDLTKETERAATVIGTTQTASSIPTGPVPTLGVPFVSSSQQLSLLPESLPSETGRIQELENEVRVLQEKLAETRVVLAKEGVDSVIPLYNELLALRDAKREAALRDAETTLAYISTQEYCFTQQLETMEKRKRLLDLHYDRRGYSGEDTLEGLMRDVDKLEKLGRDLKQLRSEYQQSIIGTHAINDTIPTPQLGEKRLRTSEENFQVLLEKQSKKDQEIKALRYLLDAQKRETEEWKQRYESALQTMNGPHESAVFNTLLQDIEVRISQEAVRRSDLLCRLFGWELLDLNDTAVVIARVGSAEEQLTLPIPVSSNEGTLAMATSIVLAKKVLEGSGVFRGQNQENQRTEMENKAENLNQAAPVGQNEGIPTDPACSHENTRLTVEESIGIDNTNNSNAVETDNIVVGDLPKEELAPEDDSAALESQLEPSFYNSGLWDE